MNNEEFKEQFEKNVEYLQRNIPPDDIYLFCEQTFMASLYFLKKWSDCIDINEECEANLISRKWVYNILGLLKCQQDDIDINLDLNLESMYEDNN